MSGPLQVEFYFTGVPLNDPGAGARTDYAGFNLNGVEYKIGDCAFLYPEDESVPPYVGRILSTFHDRQTEHQYCVEVAWFERRAHLEPVDSQSGDWERELVALEETDINPIGCISGKAVVLKAGDYEEASIMAKPLDSEDWLFCRGVYKPDENCIVPYPELVEQMGLNNGTRIVKRTQTGVSGQAEGVADSDDIKRRRLVEEHSAAPVRRTGKLVSGRTCVECGATQTPQWREGPVGPKTLCNACGVRYVRAQQRANKRSAPVGVSRGSCGGGARQARNAKAAKAEAAAAARNARNAAPQEASQRPLRQAALMAASKTAQYARTGVFPKSATDLHEYDMPDDEAAAQQQHVTEGAAGHGGACAMAVQSRPGTPNCSSFESSGSMYDAGVTVEVVVGPADGDGDCCGGMAGAKEAVLPTPALQQQQPMMSSMPQAAVAAALGMHMSPLGVPARAGTITGLCRVPAAPAGGVPMVPVMMPTTQGVMPQLPVGVPVGGVDFAAGAVAGGNVGYMVDGGLERVAGAYDGADDGATRSSAFGLSSVAESAAAAAAAAAAAVAVGYYVPATMSGVESPAATCAQILSAPVSPSARSSFGGSQMQDAKEYQQQQEHEQHQMSAGAGDGDGSGMGLVDDNLNSMYGGLYGGQLGCGDEYGPLVEVDFGLGAAAGMGNGALFDELNADENDDDLPNQLPYPLIRPSHTHLNHHQSCNLSDQPCQGNGCDPRVDSTAAADSEQQPDSSNAGAPGAAAATGDDEDEGGVDVRSVADLPAVATLAAAFCPDLAIGSETRLLLDSMPVLTQQQQQQDSSSQLEGSCVAAVQSPASAARVLVSAFAAAAAAFGDAAEEGDATVAAGSSGAATFQASGSGAVPGEAVEQLVSLGRRASRAATDALVADAALQAVSQVFEAHQEAARRAHEAAVTNLGRLKDCLTSLASSASANGAVDLDAAASAAAMGVVPGPAAPPVLLPEPPLLGGTSSGNTGVHLIDLRDLGAGFGGGGGFMVNGLAGGCGFDAGELVVAVHS